jgi:hypothetical protein
MNSEIIFFLTALRYNLALKERGRELVWLLQYQLHCSDFFLCISFKLCTINRRIYKEKKKLDSLFLVNKELFDSSRAKVE